MLTRRGFTLVELVVVILVIGILAVVAAPRFLDTSKSAEERALEFSLRVVRDGIDFYKAKHGRLPGADGAPATLKADLSPYLRGQFPIAPLGPAKGDARINMKGDGVPLDGVMSPVRAWRYDYTTGEFIFNFKGISSDSVTEYSDL